MMDMFYSTTVERKVNCFRCGKTIVKGTRVFRLALLSQKYARVFHVKCIGKVLDKASHDFHEQLASEAKDRELAKGESI